MIRSRAPVVLLALLLAAGAACTAADSNPVLPPPTEGAMADRHSDPLCGGCLSESTTLTADLHCEAHRDSAVLRFCASNIELDCAGHAIVAPDDKGMRIIEIEGFRNVAIRNCQFANGGTAVHALGALDVEIAGNTFFNPCLHAVSLLETNRFLIRDNAMIGDGSSIAAIEIRASRDGAVEGNGVLDFQQGGIQLYGAQDVRVEANYVRQIADTCFGLFGDPQTGRLTSRIDVLRNEGGFGRQVGIVEVMDGSAYLRFAANDFHDSIRCFNVYDPDSAPAAHHLEIVGNRLARCEAGVRLAGEAERIVLRGNAFRDNPTALYVENANDVEATENTIQGAGPGGTAVLRERGRGLRFTHNVLQGQNAPLILKDPNREALDLTRNFWSECPQLAAFDVGGAHPLPFINPVNPLPCPFVEPPMILVDQDGDGRDDHQCRRPTPPRCVPGTAP